MAVRNPFTITYGALGVGGSSNVYLLDGPYVIDKAFESIRLVFDVVVVGTSFSDLASKCDALEQAYDARDKSFVIDIDGTAWTYTFGTSVLNTTATISKSGDRERDRGYSRAYTCSIEGELPASDQSGLRDLEIAVSYQAGRQRIVSMRGTYTTIGGSGARQTYESDFDSEASTFLSALDGSATFELVAENVSQDRNNHIANFDRQYVELLFSQADGTLDKAEIRDHRVSFTDLSQYPGDAKKGITRLRRVVGTFDCAIDIDETTDVKGTYADIVRPHILQTFQANFTPSVFGVEDERAAYDETAKRMSVSVQIVWQPSNANPGENQNIVEIAQSLGYRESRQIDYTPIHSGDEYAMNADPGWATRERVWTRTVISIGDDAPRWRIGNLTRENGLPSGEFTQAIEGSREGLAPIPGVRSEGWNLISNTSEVSDQWVGDPANDAEQIKLSVLSETVVERYNKRGTGGSAVSGSPFIRDVAR